MDENSKKGARDISDLKARLGLKKAGAAGVPGATEAPLTAPPGFGPPQGQAPQAAAAEPEPAAPAAPDPRRDPFAPQAPAYGYGYGMPLPGVDDGKPVEQISKPTPWGRIAGYVALLFAGLLFGGGSGASCAGRRDYNLATTDAGKLLTEVETLSKSLIKIGEQYAQSKEAAQNNPDVKLAEDLVALGLKEPDIKKSVFHTNYASFEPPLAIERLFEYYTDTIRLYKMIEEHGRKTAGEKDAIERYLKEAAARGEKNYGVIFDMSGTIPLANLVEMGSIVCPTEGDTSCKPDVMKFNYRSQPGAEWSTRPVKGKPETTVTPIFRTPLFSQVASGNPDIVAAQSCARRQAEIRGITQQLGNTQKELLDSLKKMTERPHLLAP